MFHHIAYELFYLEYHKCPEQLKSLPGYHVDSSAGYKANVSCVLYPVSCVSPVLGGPNSKLPLKLWIDLPPQAGDGLQKYAPQTFSIQLAQKATHWVGSLAKTSLKIIKISRVGSLLKKG